MVINNLKKSPTAQQKTFPWGQQSLNHQTSHQQMEATANQGIRMHYIPDRKSKQNQIINHVGLETYFDHWRAVNFKTASSVAVQNSP